MPEGVGYGANYGFEDYRRGVQFPGGGGGATGSDIVGGATGVAGFLANPYGQVGLELGKQVFSYLGGGAKRKRLKQARTDVAGSVAELKGLKGKDIFNVPLAHSLARRSIFSDAKRIGANVDRNLGLNTGAGAGAFFEQTAGRGQQIYADLFLKNQQGRSTRDFRIDQILLNESQRRVAANA